MCLQCSAKQLETSSALRINVSGERAKQLCVDSHVTSWVDHSKYPCAGIGRECPDRLRAAMIEEQWQDALGKHFQVVQARVKEQLQEKGAWEDVAAEI